MLREQIVMDLEVAVGCHDHGLRAEDALGVAELERHRHAAVLVLDGRGREVLEAGPLDLVLGAVGHQVRAVHGEDVEIVGRIWIISVPEPI